MILFFFFDVFLYFFLDIMKLKCKRIILDMIKLIVNYLGVVFDERSFGFEINVYGKYKVLLNEN